MRRGRERRAVLRRGDFLSVCAAVSLKESSGVTWLLTYVVSADLLWLWLLCDSILPSARAHALPAFLVFTTGAIVRCKRLARCMPVYGLLWFVII